MYQLKRKSKMDSQFKEIRAKIDKALKKRIPNYLYSKFVIEYDYEYYFLIDIYIERSSVISFDSASIYTIKKQILQYLNNK